MATLYGALNGNVEFANNESEHINQTLRNSTGAYLNPMLVSLVMTVVSKDIHSRKGGTIARGKIDGLNFTGVLCAGDALVVFERTRDTNKLLREIITNHSITI